MSLIHKPGFGSKPIGDFLKSSAFGILLILLAMCAVMFVVSPPFGNMSNLLSVARSFSAIAVAGIGVSVIIIAGGIDLSVGSVYGLAGVTAALLLTVLQLPMLVAVLGGIVAGALIGFINGSLVIKARLPPFIATLGTLSIARGLCFILTKGYPITKLPKSFLYIGQGYLAGIPFPVVIMLVIGMIGAVFLNKTTTGRRIFALGGNAEATRISGINTNKLTLFAYTLGSALASVAGIISASRLGVGQPTAGTGFELDAIAAVVIGGASLSGGEGTILGTILGAAIMGVLRNALVLLAVNAYWQQFIIGFVIILAVSFDQMKNRRQK